MPAAAAPVLIRTIADYHRRWGLPQPAHPLVSLLRFEDLPYQPTEAPRAVVHGHVALTACLMGQGCCWTTSAYRFKHYPPLLTVQE